MLEFLKRNALGKVVNFNFFFDDEYGTGFLNDMFINRIEQHPNNENLFVFNKNIGVVIHNSVIDEEYPNILSIYNHGKIRAEISFINNEIDIWSK